MIKSEMQMKNNVKLRHRTVFLVLGICLSIACTNNAPPPVQVSTSSSPVASRTGQPSEPAAAGHDEATHELENKMPRISAEELKRLVAARQAVIVDVRSAEDYAQAHIQGAINLPIQQIEAGRYPNLPGGQRLRLISYCT
jgi:hypothetical protein